jgi:hypothetical protein
LFSAPFRGRLAPFKTGLFHIAGAGTPARAKTANRAKFARYFTCPYFEGRRPAVRGKKKTDSTAELYAMLQQAARNHEFNIAADLAELQKQHGKLNKNQFKKYLDALFEKYTAGEYSVVHSVLMQKCREGDMAAIRLYHGVRKDGGGGGEEVVIIDDI